MSDQVPAIQIGKQDSPQVRPSVQSLKNKGGRPTNAEIIARYEKEKTVQPSPLVLQGKHLEGIVQIPFEALAHATHEKAWILDPDEICMISQPLADVLNDYLPEIVKRYPKIAILAVAVISLGSKKAFDVKRAKELRTAIVVTENKPKIPPIQPASAQGGLSDAERILKERTTGA